MSIISTTTVTLDCGPFGEVEFNVEYEYSYDRGRVSGPPEDCYPPSEELDILQVRCNIDGHHMNVSRLLQDNDSFRDMVADIAHEAWQDSKSGYSEEDY